MGDRKSLAGRLCAISLLALAATAHAQVSPIVIEHDVTVQTMTSDRFTWIDSSGQPRVAVLAHNDQNGPQGTRGGELREFKYQVGGNTRDVTAATTSAASGFGYVVSHPDGGENCTADGDSSSLGHFTAGTWTRVFEGRHHVIFRFQQNYPRYCTTGAAADNVIPVTIDWIFSTGRDSPVWAITYDMSAIPADTLNDDSRAPYGELLFDGSSTEAGASTVAGVSWGDQYKFFSTTNPVSMESSWTWNTPNTIPYVKLWTTAVDATMGSVLTQTISQQDAGGYWGIGSWTHTSGDGNACTAAMEVAQVMPCDYNWPYQSINYSLTLGSSAATNNTRLAWGTEFGFLGQTSYEANGGTDYGGNGPNVFLPGYPKKSYSVYVVLGTHSGGPVEAQVAQVENVQSMTLSAGIGSVVSAGPAGVNRSDTVAYNPVGYNQIYGALAFSAASNQLDANIAVGSGTLMNPMIIVSNYTGGAPQVTFNGTSLTADVDYFASLRSGASELWITLNRNLSGLTNHLVIAPSGVPATPTGFAATAVSTAQVNLSWTAVAGASSYQVDRLAPGGTFTQIATPMTNSYSDTAVASGTAYCYRVRAVGPGGASGNSTADVATTVVFTDSPLLTGIIVKAVHLAQLRNAVNLVRALAGKTAASYTDAAVAGVTVKAIHVTEMRSALDEAFAALDVPVAGYTDATLTGVPVKQVHFQEIRDRLQ